MTTVAADALAFDPNRWRLLLVVVLAVSAVSVGYFSRMLAVERNPIERAQRPVGNESKLIDGLIGAYDTATDESVKAHVSQVLRSVDVAIVTVPPQTVFDAGIHRAVGVERTVNDADNRVAHTVRPGWTYVNGDTIRIPEVAVWKRDAL